MTTSDACVVLITLPDGPTAAGMAKTLVEERLAACASIIPDVRSIYRWEGQVQDEGEVLLVVKTRQALADRLTDRVCGLHPYAEPEIISLPVTGGSASYLAWIASETREG